MKGILMKPEMVVAIAERRKTNTRRLGRLKEINQEPDRWLKAVPIPKDLLLYTPFKGIWQFSDAHDNIKLAKPHYQVGETVYIKEALYCNPYFYEAGYLLDQNAVFVNQTIGDILKWRWGRDTLSAMFMPQEAARYFIVITDVRAERLQEITGTDCLAEGVEPCKYKGYTESYKNNDYLIGHFATLWNSINKDYPWDSNPYVWAYSFRKIDKQEIGNAELIIVSPNSEETKEKISLAKMGKPAPWNKKPSKIINGILHYECSKCHQFLPAESFFKNKRDATGITSGCKECHTEISIRTRDPENTKRLRRIHEAKRRALQMGASIEPISYEGIQQRDRMFCGLCGKKVKPIELTFDHIIPLSCGGTHAEWNLQVAHSLCNCRKYIGLIPSQTRLQLV